MKINKVGQKYIIEKDGMYCGLTYQQVLELIPMLIDIKEANEKPKDEQTNEGNMADEATANHPKFKKLNDEISKIAEEIKAKSRSGKNWFSYHPLTKDICNGLVNNGVELGPKPFPLSDEEVQAKIKIIMDSPIQKSEHPVQLHVQRG